MVQVGRLAGWQAGRKAVPTFPSTRLDHLIFPVMLSVLCRAPRSGSVTFALCWRYEPLVRLEGLPHRTVRCAVSAEALPGLQLSANLMAGGLPGCALGACLAQLQLHNVSSSAAITISGLACPGSSTWQLDPADAFQGNSSLQIAPDASACLHRQLIAAAALPMPTGAAAAEVAPERSGLLHLSDGEVFLLEAARQAAAAAIPKHLQPTAQQLQQEKEQRQRRRQNLPSNDRLQQQQAGVDLVVRWRSEGNGASVTRRGFCCLLNQRCGGQWLVDEACQGMPLPSCLSVHGSTLLLLLSQQGTCRPPYPGPTQWPF